MSDAGSNKSEPKVRADARRNEDAVLEAAKAIFSDLGVDAPIRKIAQRAGWNCLSPVSQSLGSGGGRVSS